MYVRKLYGKNSEGSSAYLCTTAYIFTCVCVYNICMYRHDKWNNERPYFQLIHYFTVSPTRFINNNLLLCIILVDMKFLSAVYA